MIKNLKDYKNRKKLLIIVFSIVVVIVISLICVFIWGVGSCGNTLEITSIKIVKNGQEIDNLNVSFTEEKVDLNVEINDEGINDLGGKQVLIEWTIISNDDLGCKISNDGLLEIGNKLGVVTIQVAATSENSAKASAQVCIIAPEFMTLQSIDVNASQNGLTFIEGQVFDPSGIDVIAHFIDVEKTPLLSNFVYNTSPLTMQDTEIELKVTHAGVDMFALIPIIVEPKTLQSIEVTKYPANLQYIEGQRLDLSGLEVTAHYEYIDEIINDYSVNLNDILSTNDDELIIVYYNGTIIKEAKIEIVVAPRTLQSIEIVSNPRKLRYIQGQKFDARGIVVLAHYEYISLDVSELIEWDKRDKLLIDDKIIKITYEENGIKLTQNLSVDVDMPYSKVRKIILENPLDATLSWIFSYSDDGFTNKIDNTQIDGHTNLLYDEQNGIYVAPVGAVITIMRVSPAITDFIVDGEEQNLMYPEITTDFELAYGEEDIYISFKKVLGDRITIRFSTGAKGANWAFIYPLSYNGTMRTQELNKIANIYQDTVSYYFEYSIGEEVYTFSELCELRFSSDTFIKVTRVENEVMDSIKLIVRYPDGHDFNFTIERYDEFAFNKLPKIEKIGYKLNFSVTKDGTYISSADFNNWLLHATDGDVVYAVYSLMSSEVSGKILGEWGCSCSTEDHSVVVNLSFNKNGTYRYLLFLDSKLNCEFEGIYNYGNEILTILSMEFKGEYQIITVNDFRIVVDDKKIYTSLFVIDGISVMIGEVTLFKVV